MAANLGDTRRHQFDPVPGAGAVAGATSAVAWSAIFGGAISALAATLILVSLGAGLGLTAVSPWPDAGSSLKTFGVLAGIWLIVVQWISAALGGYLAGRLRTKSVAVHTDEAFFRDTAHGLLAWALATLVVIGLATAATSSGVSGGVRAATALGAGAAQGAGQGAAQQSAGGNDPTGYFVDLLFRSDNPSAAAQGQDARAEATRMLVSGLRNGDLQPADRTYLAQLVAAKTGLAQADAEKRVDSVIAQAKDTEAKARQAADAARKTAASVSMLTALSLVIGAFIASAMAAFGGRLRDAA